MPEPLTYSWLNDHPALHLFNLLLEPSPSGVENRVTERVKQTLTEWNMPHEQDAVGNVIVHLPGQNPDALLRFRQYAGDADGFYGFMAVRVVSGDGTQLP